MCASELLMCASELLMTNFRILESISKLALVTKPAKHQRKTTTMFTNCWDCNVNFYVSLNQLQRKHQCKNTWRGSNNWL